MYAYSNSNIKYLPITTAAILASAAVLAMAWPHVVAAAHAEAARLIEQAPQTGAAEATSFYRLASTLDPGNRESYLGLAKIQIATGQSEAALRSLKHAGEETETLRLRLKTLVELGNFSGASLLADALAQPGASDADIILSGLAYALAERTGDIDALLSRVASPEAAQRLARAKAGNVTLAAELYASGLPNSSRTFAEKLPVSFKRNVLLGRISYAQNTRESLVAATGYFSSACTINPGDLSAHELLADVFAVRGMVAESSTQTILVQKIRSGRP